MINPIAHSVHLPKVSPARRVRSVYQDSYRSRLRNSTPQHASPKAVSKQEIKSLWDAFAPYFDFFQHSPTYTDMVQDVVRSSGARAGHQALDLGCGTGRIALALAARGAQVEGLDWSDGMLARARANVPAALAPHVTFRNAGLEYLRSLPTASKDVVTAGLFLIYLDHPEEWVREVNRILKPGGKFVMSNPKEKMNPLPIFLDTVRRIFFHPVRNWKILTLANARKAFRAVVCETQIKRWVESGVFRLFSETGTAALLTRCGFHPQSIQVSKTFCNQVYLASAVKTVPDAH